MRGRPPTVPASAVLDEVRHLIARAAGAPCPAIDLLAASVGVDWRIVSKAIAMLKAGGELKIERTAKCGGLKRRMRVLVNGRWSPWTAWTKRGPGTALLRRGQLFAAMPSADHIAVVTAAGRF